jgi:hypothetical protein
MPAEVASDPGALENPGPVQSLDGLALPDAPADDVLLATEPASLGREGKPVRVLGRGKPIDIHVGLGSPHIARMSVTDHGIGIAPERLPYIFERFERAVPSSQYGGIGLGRYIVRSIVKALGGSVDARSVLGSGEFTVELPQAGPGPPPIEMRANLRS